MYLVRAAREGREGHILDRAARVFDDRLEGNAVEGDSVVGEGNAHHVLARNANHVSSLSSRPIDQKTHESKRTAFCSQLTRKQTRSPSPMRQPSLKDGSRQRFLCGCSVRATHADGLVDIDQLRQRLGALADRRLDPRNAHDQRHLSATILLAS